MASQKKKWPELMSQFSSRDEHIAKPPVPKRQKQKINLQYSQLEIQKVDVTKSTTNNPPNSAVEDKNNAPEMDWDSSWSDDDLNTLLSQYDKPKEVEPKEVEKKQGPSTSTTNPAVQEKTKLQVQIAINSPKVNPPATSLQESPKVVTTPEVQIIHQKNQMSTNSAVKFKKPPSARPPKVIEPKRLEEDIPPVIIPNEENSSLLDFSFKTQAVENFHEKVLEAETLNTCTATLEKIHNLFDVLIADLMKVPQQDDLILLHSKPDLINFEPTESSEVAKISQCFLELSEYSRRDANFFALTCKIKTANIDLEVRSVSYSEGVEPLPTSESTPLLLQQIALICDLAVVRPDFYKLTPVVSASIKYIAPFLVHEDCSTNSDIIVWILKRSSYIQPMPGVLLSLLEALECILSKKPNLMLQFCSSELHSSNCMVHKILKNMEVLINRCLQPEPNISQLQSFGAKLADMMSAIHFAPPYYLPSCLLLAEDSTCLKTTFTLAARINIFLIRRLIPETNNRALAAKFVNCLHWLSSAENAKFKEMLGELGAELFFFLVKQKEIKHTGFQGAAIESLLASYPTWGNFHEAKNEFRLEGRASSNKTDGVPTDNNSSVLRKKMKEEHHLKTTPVTPPVRKSLLRLSRK